MTYTERENGMTVGGQGYRVRGSQLSVGEAAPDFRLVAKDMTTRSLADYRGRVKLVSVVPSLDTWICSNQTHRFDAAAADLGDKVAVLSVSADLPFAQNRWRDSEGTQHIETLSTHKDMQFSDDYGVHNIEWRVNMRSVFVIDAQDRIAYVEYVTSMDDEVNFEAALQAVQQSLAEATTQSG